MATYAKTTTVPSEKSRMEIERTLTRYGATAFAYASMPGQAAISFVAQDRKIRFILQLPDPEEPRFVFTPSTGRRRTATAAAAEYEQATRQTWRALLLLVKAKLEAVESKITSFEEEFFANILLPGGRTIYEAAAENVGRAYVEGSVPLTFLQLEA